MVAQRKIGLAVMLATWSSIGAAKPAPGLSERMDTLLGAVSDGGQGAGEAVLSGLFDGLVDKNASAPKLRTANLDDEWGGATGRPPDLPELRQPRQSQPRENPPSRETAPRESAPRESAPQPERPTLERPTQRETPPRREPPPPTRRPA